MKIQILRSSDGHILYEHETADNSLKLTLQTAASSGANLRGANLRGANLYGANLCGANLYGADLCGDNLYCANLYGANLYGADLRSANLYGANLRGANLYGADLRGANLYGANLCGANLYGANLRSAKLSDTDTVIESDRPVIMISNIGSRDDTLIAFLTNNGIRLKTGCFYGDMETFLNLVRTNHRTNHRTSTHAIEYQAACDLILLHAKLWTK